MFNPNYVSVRPIGKFGSTPDAKSSKIWYENVVRRDQLKEDGYQRSLLRQIYPYDSFAEIEKRRLRLKA